MDLEQLRNDLTIFAEAKLGPASEAQDLVMALASEPGELLDLFRWLTPQESASIKDSSERIHEVREEIADVLIYLVRLADKLDISIEGPPSARRSGSMRTATPSRKLGIARRSTTEGTNL